MALAAQIYIKDVPLEDLIAKLHSNKAIQESKLARREPDRSQAVALKIERAFDLAQHADFDDDSEDEITALMTRALRVAGASGKIFSKGKEHALSGLAGR